jgi:hypothetical protein
MLFHRVWLVALFGVCCLLLSVAPLPTEAQDFKPLDEVIASENSDWNTLYVFQRCAAIHSAAAYRLKNSGRNDVAQLIDASETSSEFWLSFVMQKAEQLNVSGELENLLNRTSQMMIVYLDVMEKNYTLTGSAFYGFFIEDLNTCNELQAN